MRTTMLRQLQRVLGVAIVTLALASSSFGQEARLEQPSPTGLLLGAAQLGLNQGSMTNSARSPLDRHTQDDLLFRQRVALSSAEDILSDPLGMQVVENIYFRLPPLHLRDLYVEVYGREDGDRELERLDQYAEDGFFIPPGTAPNQAARLLRRLNWPFQVFLDGRQRIPDSMNEFEFNRLLSALRRDLDRHIADISLPNPLPVTAVCTIGLGAYDFSQEAFPLSPAQIRASCFSNLDTNSIGQRRLGNNYAATIPALPDMLSIPASDAEAFRNITGDFVDLILPATLSVSGNKDTRTEQSFRYVLQATGPFSLQDRDSLDILWQWEDSDTQEAVPQQNSWVEDRTDVAPTGPLLASSHQRHVTEDTVFLLRLAAGLSLDDRDWFEAMRSRRSVELDQDRRIRQASRNGRLRGWADPWPRFFPRDLQSGDLTVFRGEFEQWNRARVAALPQQMVLSSWGLNGFESGASPTLLGHRLSASVQPLDIESRDVPLVPRVAIRLPAFAGDYHIDPPSDLLDQARGLEEQDKTIITDLTLEIGHIQSEDGNLIVEAQPTQVRFVAYDLRDTSDDIELAMLTLDVPEREFGTVDAELAPAPLIDGPIYWETLDLLRLLHAAPGVDDPELQQMMARRFDAEKNDPDTPEPHFFNLVDELPTDAESKAQFLTWSQSRFPFVERPLVLRLENAAIDPAFGGAFRNFRSHGNWTANTWFRGFHPSCQIDRASSGLMAEVSEAEPDGARRILACAAILAGRETAMSPAHVLAYQYAQRPRPHDQTVVFDLDKAPAVTEAMRAERVVGLSQLDVVVRVSGASQMRMVDPIPAEIGEQVASAIMEGEPIEVRLDTLQSRPLASSLTSFAAEVQSVSMTDQYGRSEPVTLATQDINSFPVDQFIDALASISEREASLEDESAMVAVPDVPSDGASDTADLDILGLSIGMAIDEAEGIVTNHMPVGWTLVADRRSAMIGTNAVPSAWSSGRMFVDESNREFIALYYEPDAPDFGLVGVMRWVFVEAQSVDRTRLGPALQQRYGSPFEASPMEDAVSTGFLWTWTGPSTQANCGYVPARRQSDIWQLQNPDAPFQPPFAIYDLALPDLRTRPNVGRYLMSEDVQVGWLCPPTLSVRTSSFRPSFGLPEDQNHAIVSVLYDEQRAINTLRAAEAARAIAGSTQEPSDADAEFEIDF
ncbi:MAG: hypothetical protein NXH91_19145 [Phyllobacteriaceae bacterium]|nr:hypothetical protein [Phyllobacteriaceae bacterium]